MTPEPCLRRDDRCAAPVSCAAWGYCRERNMPGNCWPGTARDEENRDEARKRTAIPDSQAGRVEDRALPALRDLYRAAGKLDAHDTVVRAMVRAGVAAQLGRAEEAAGDVLEQAVRRGWTDGPDAADPRTLAGAHSPGDWRVEQADDPRHAFRIAAEAGHVASVACWSRYGTPSPTSAANAALLAAAPALATALRDLLRWAEVTGGWEGACWDRARAALGAALGTAPGNPQGEG